MTILLVRRNLAKAVFLSSTPAAPILSDHSDINKVLTVRVRNGSWNSTLFQKGTDAALFGAQSDTIMSGVIYLWHSGSDIWHSWYLSPACSFRPLSCSG